MAPSDGPFRHGCVATPHHVASDAGLRVLRSGGNALDAAIAANLVLGVVMPFSCGIGGDLFAMVWRDGDGPAAYNGSGRAPAAASIERVRERAGGGAMPERGPLPVTVPGAVDGWHALLERFGTRSFAELCGPAMELATDGFEVSSFAAGHLAGSAAEFPAAPAFDEWRRVYGDATAGATLRQPGLARTLEAVSASGPAAYYGGPVAEAIAGTVRRYGGLMTVDDLAGHRGEWVRPMRARYRDAEIVEMPPNTQGVAALEALRLVDAAGPLAADGAARHHVLIEAVKIALADRDRFVTDPDHMAIPAERLVSDAWVRERLHGLDPDKAGDPNATVVGGGDTVYLCAADGEGMLVSLIQSNFYGFGSGVTVPEWGINLQNRGATFSLEPGHANAIAPRKRTLHTLIPAMAFRGGRPWLVFGSMGGHAQAQIHVQLLARLVDDGDAPQAAIDAPRWTVEPAGWSVRAEHAFDAGAVAGLRDRGHRVSVAADPDEAMGWAQVIRCDPDGYVAGSDRRSEGAALGL
ncbi:MAG TPA: gamma-glutamyltransferase family protein [Actinomycetota bacterium]